MEIFWILWVAVSIQPVTWGVAYRRGYWKRERDEVQELIDEIKISLAEKKVDEIIENVTNDASFDSPVDAAICRAAIRTVISQLTEANT